MAYSEAADVKTVMQIAAEEETFDAEITAAITSGDALIDKMLEPYDLTVPAEVPQVIKDASVYFAGWLFRRRRDPVGAEAFYAEAMRFLESYAVVEQDAEGAFKVVSDQ